MYEARDLIDDHRIDGHRFLAFRSRKPLKLRSVLARARAGRFSAKSPSYSGNGRTLREPPWRAPLKSRSSQSRQTAWSWSSPKRRNVQSLALYEHS